MLNIETMPLGSYQTNCYIVWEEGNDRCVVIDPGFEPQTVLLACRRLNKTVDAILLTHGHFDHVGGVREIAENTGCRVYMEENERFMPSQLTAGPLYYTDFYENGQVQAAGITFEVLHTPGHTQGSVCLLTAEHMFSGDTLFAGTCGRTDLPGGSWETIRKSLQTLAKLEKNYIVHPGHGDSTTLDNERMYNPYMR